MANSKKYICAVGDSSVYGSELIMTHCKQEFENVAIVFNPACSTYINLEFNQTDDMQLQARFDARLNEMRFSSLVANTLGYGHFNFSIGGASQEGIKFQTYLLLQRLKELNIDLADTVWIVGLTMPYRRLMLADPHNWTMNNRIDNLKQNIYEIWARETVRTFMGDRLEQTNKALSTAFTKETIAATSTTQSFIHWLMCLLDTVNILKAHNVQQVIPLNLFVALDFNKFDNCNLPEHTRQLLIDLSSSLLQTIVPDSDKSLNELFHNDPNYTKCSYNHPTASAHKIIADYLVTRIQEGNKS